MRPTTIPWLLALASIACTPYGIDLDDSVIPDEREADSEADAEADSELLVDELEPVYELFPDDDRASPVETGDSIGRRCAPDAGLPDKAFEVEDPDADPEAGMLGVERNGKVLALPLQQTRFDTVVVGTVAETEITQVFANPFPEPIEAVYMFPLHERAAVDDYWLKIGEIEVRGQMQTRAQAQETYANAKSEGRAAGLLEQERPNVFTQHVANIPPGESIEISMHVVQPLEQDHGVYSLVLPTVVGPRYIPGTPNGHGGTDRVPDADKVTAPIIPKGFTTCASVDVSVAIESGLRPRALRSSFHAVDIQREGDVAFVSLDPSAGPIPADRDFILSWDLGQADPRAAIVAQADPGNSGGYFTLTLQPPELVPDEDAVARELVFVVDNSGSMSGVPIDTAKALMQRSLSGLRPDDMFTVLRFSESASALSETMLPATTDNIQAGRDYVETMEGMGGTEMTEGIRAALALPHAADRVRIVMFLTDGYIGDEAEIFKLLESEVGDTRLFALGVGTAPNRYLLDGMATVGRGAVTYAGEGDAIEAVVDHFYERIETPVLTDIEIDWKGLGVSEVYPAKLPDLFAGQPLTVYGRYTGTPSGPIVLRGQARAAKIALPVDFDIAKAEDIAGVSSMWARNKIDGLLGYPNQAGSAETEQAVVEVALAYRIMTEFTAFVAVTEHAVVEVDQPSSKPSLTIEQSLPIPSGTTHPGGSSGLLGMGTVSGVAYGSGSSSVSGSGSGGGTGSGYGSGSGAGFGGRGHRVPQVRSARAQVQGSLDKDIIRRIVRAHLNEVRGCYNAALINDPNVLGRVVIQFVIAASGKVASAIVQTNDTGDSALGNCIAKHSRAWRFPKVEGSSGQVVVSYPFNLSPN